MEDKEILKAHIAKIVLLTDEEFDYFFSLRALKREGIAHRSLLRQNHLR